MLSYFKAFMLARELLAEAEKGNTVNNTTTPGWKTSEFWLHVLGQAPTLAAYFLGASNPVVLALAAAAGLGSAIYTLSRSHIKATEAANAVAPHVLAAITASTAALNALAASPAAVAAPAAAPVVPAAAPAPAAVAAPAANQNDPSKP